MWDWIRSTMNPAGYHGPHAGQRLRRPFFEGWYFKLVDSTENARWVIIPGVFHACSPNDSHAFIQVLDGVSGEMSYHAYPIPEFTAARAGFDVRIGPNRFNAAGLSVDIADTQRTLRGSVRFRDPAPTGWPVSLFSPGIMGWYAWVPFMQCYHGVISFDHGLEGTLQAGSRTLNLTGGRGYIEKDWGQAFPSAWVWTQTNHFAQPGTCLTASIARIPWLGSSFPGFIVGLWHQQHLYRFATYTGARTRKLKIGDRQVDWVIAGRQHTLELTAFRAADGVLRAPTPTGMDRRIAETLDARVHVRLSRRGAVLFEDEGRNAGLEVMGDTIL